MTLSASLVQLEASLDKLEIHFSDFAANKGSIASHSAFTVLDECLLEGLVSRAWQAWGSFCRDCVVKSCMGTVDGSGNIVVGLPPALSETHVSSAAIKAKRKATPPHWGGVNSTLRSEPTWGDVDVLHDVITRLQPSNALQLLAGFSSASQSAKAIQKIRNGAAHTNAQTLREVVALGVTYSSYSINQPIQAVYWTDPSSNDFVITHSIHELRSAAHSAIT